MPQAACSLRPSGALGSRHGRSEAQPEDRFPFRHLTRQEEAHPPRWSCESSGMSGGAGGSSLAQPFNKRGGTSELGQIASASTAVTWAGNAVAQPVCAAVMGAMSGAVRPGRSEIGVGVDHEVRLPRLKVRIRTGVVISHLYKLDFMDSAARTGVPVRAALGHPTATRAVNWGAARGGASRRDRRVAGATSRRCGFSGKYGPRAARFRRLASLFLELSAPIDPPTPTTAALSWLRPMVAAHGQCRSPSASGHRWPRAAWPRSCG